MKLESKHIAPYLPYGLKVIYEGHVKEVHGLMNEEIYIEYNGIGTDMSGKELFEIKPLFLPLSALTEQLPDGTIPIVELAKMALTYPIEIDVYKFEKQYVDGEFIVAESENSMRLIFDGKSFWMQNGYGNIAIANNQLQLFEYLFSNHFDVFSLISCQLADAK